MTRSPNLESHQNTRFEVKFVIQRFFSVIRSSFLQHYIEELSDVEDQDLRAQESDTREIRKLRENLAKQVRDNFAGNCSVE